MDSAELINMMVGDASSSEVSDYIKGVLYSKAGEKVDAMRPEVAAGLLVTNQKCLNNQRNKR